VNDNAFVFGRAAPAILHTMLAEIIDRKDIVSDDLPDPLMVGRSSRFWVAIGGHGRAAIPEFRGTCQTKKK
jgi:hypothetical protein